MRRQRGPSGVGRRVGLEQSDQMKAGVAQDILTSTGTGDATPTVEVARRRGRQPKVSQSGSDFVEWWKPGWRERY